MYIEDGECIVEMDYQKMHQDIFDINKWFNIDVEIEEPGETKSESHDDTGASESSVMWGDKELTYGENK